MEVSDESVAECAEGLVLGVAGGSALVLELVGSKVVAEGGERPQVGRVDEALVASQCDPSAA